MSDNKPSLKKEITPRRQPEKVAIEPLINEAAVIHDLDHRKHCLWLFGFFIFLYLAIVAIFWILGTITHPTELNMIELKQAQGAREIRDGLADKFGPFPWVSTNNLKESASSKVEDFAQKSKEQVIDSATSAAENEIKERAGEIVEEVIP